MTNPTTPQDVHAAFVASVRDMDHIPGVSEAYEAIAPIWDDLSEEQKFLFAEMADKLNRRIEQEGDDHGGASSLAGLVLREHIERGGTVEIPSLGITLNADNLRDDEE